MLKINRDKIKNFFRLFFRKENAFFVLIVGIFSTVGVFLALKDFIFVSAGANATFSSDFSTVDNCDTLTFTAGGVSTGAALNSDLAVEGTNGIEWAISAVGWGTMYKTVSPTQNLQNKQLWYYLWTGTGKVGGATYVLVRDHLTSVSTTLASASGLSSWQYCSSLSDCQSKLVSGWNSIKIYTTQPGVTRGTFDPTVVNKASIDYYSDSVMTKRAAAVMGMDFWRAGTTVYFYGGTATVPVSFYDVLNYSTSTANQFITVEGGLVKLNTSLRVGDGTNSTYFTEASRYVYMNMYNSDDKIKFTLMKLSTTTLGVYQNGFPISGVTVAYPASQDNTSPLRSIPFIIPENYSSTVSLSAIA